MNVPWLGASLRLASVFLSMAAFLIGCKVGPDYHRPPPLVSNDLPATFSSSPQKNSVEWKQAEPSAHLPRDGWWRIFEDSELSRLELLASTANQQLATALALFDEARASVNIARADYFPQVDVGSTYLRRRTSANEPENGHAAGTSYTFNSFILLLQAGWEADLWGRVRRQVEAATARFVASADELEAVKLAIQAQLATDYFVLRALDAEHALVVRSTETYRRSLELTVNRRKGGVASDLDVSQAQTQLQTTEADLPVLRLERLKLLHAIAVLCGRPAMSFDINVATNQTATIPEVPISLPSELLERRPDIAAAEQLMAAAN